MPAMKDLVNGVHRYRHFINGQWVNSTVKEWIEVENPATGEIIASVPKGSADDADRALVAARAAQPAWEALPPVERGQLLTRSGAADPGEPRAAGAAGGRRAGQAAARRRAARSRARRSI